jgi:hypothetical protein
VREALFALQGRDHHDWFLELAKACGLEPGQMFMVLFGMWMRHGENETNARTAFEELQWRVDAVALAREHVAIKAPIPGSLAAETEVVIAEISGQL